MGAHGEWQRVRFRPARAPSQPRPRHARAPLCRSAAASSPAAHSPTHPPTHQPTQPAHAHTGGLHSLPSTHPGIAQPLPERPRPPPRTRAPRPPPPPLQSHQSCSWGWGVCRGVGVKDEARAQGGRARERRRAPPPTLCPPAPAAQPPGALVVRLWGGGGGGWGAGASGRRGCITLLHPRAPIGPALVAKHVIVHRRRRGGALGQLERAASGAHCGRGQPRSLTPAAAAASAACGRA